MTTKTIRVVMVDDQESFRSAARLVIGMAEGFELVSEAESGEEGIESVAQLSADLVLMDIGLPGIDGLEATRRILEREPKCKVIVLSTYEASEFQSRALAAGAVAFVSKSDFDPDVLREVWEAASLEDRDTGADSRPGSHG
ncbi:MAG TPA: response regulator transcription factor [Acidimicrobiia bacterium]